MTFQLFDDLTTQTAQRIEDLASSGFYNKGSTSGKMIFHRVIQDFMIQTGDPTGTGSGQSNAAPAHDVWTAAGDTASATSNWSFTGVTTSNSDSGSLYWSITNASDTATVNIYKDAAGLQLVASGSGSVAGGSAAITLAAANSSGITGSVTLAQHAATVAQASTRKLTDFRYYGVPLDIKDNLRFTTKGVLAMARMGSYTDSNDSQFFITSGAQSSLNTQYTIFGFETTGEAVRQAIANVPVVATTPGGEASSPSTPVIVDSVQVFHDTQNGVLILNAPSGETGAADVTVTAHYSNGTTSTQTFRVYVNNAPPKLGTVADIHAIANKPSTFTIPASDADHDPMYYDGITDDSTKLKLDMVVNNATGRATLTATNAGVGVHAVEVGVRRAPTAKLIGTRGTPRSCRPTSVRRRALSVQFLPPAGQFNGFTSLNNTTGKTLQFRVSGILSGTVVTVFADGTAIGHATAAGTSVVVTTDGTTTLPDGAHRITAAQTYHYQATTVGNSSIAAGDLASTASAAAQLVVTSTPNTVPLPAESGVNRLTLRKNGALVELYNENTSQTWWSQALASATWVIFTGTADKSYVFTVDLASGGNFQVPGGVTFQGGSGTGSNTLAVRGTSGNDSFTLYPRTLFANTLAIAYSAVQQTRLEGGAGNDKYALAASSVPVSVVDTGGSDRLDFSGALGGVTVNLALDQGQAQAIAPWHTTLAITGQIESLTGTNFADNLTGGNAATSILRGFGGNDIMHGGSGNSVLLGGDGTDTLQGGAGRNFLIGGRGTDTLHGGSGDNILVGGSTSYDTNDQALAGFVSQAVARTMFAPSLRSFTSGSGRSPLLKLGVTVQDDGVRNSLFGGSMHNWFLPGAHDYWRAG